MSSKNLDGVDYYIGLDCEASSVGFAVTDTGYNVLKFNGKRMWGTHLFEEAKTAEARKATRTARRRFERRAKRILLLQEIFAEEIYKVDPTFFIRLNESKYVLEDKTNPDMNILFNDVDYDDKAFFKEYRTVYHLRKALREKPVHDPRLLYLGIQHILKYRGHFLFPGENLAAANSVEPFLDEMKGGFECLFGCQLGYSSTRAVEDALRTKKGTERKEKLAGEISIQDRRLKTMVVKLLVGYCIKAGSLFGKDYKDAPDIEFRNSSFEDRLPMLQEILSDDEFRFVMAAKGVFDWALLSSIMDGHIFISDAKVQLYESNKKDLKHLKRALKKFAPDRYEEFFHSNKEGSYSSYTGKIHDKGSTCKLKRSKTDDFYRTIMAMLEKAPKDDPDVAHVMGAIENDTFMPLLRSFRNGTIPWQVNRMELEAILANASHSFPFLGRKDPDGFTAQEKIMDLLKYRVPYYIGPLGANPNGKGTKGRNSWAERKETGRILPWNIERKVDFASAAEEFMKRVTSKCIYCKDQDVLPKNSLSYQKFMVLNELNGISVLGKRLSVEMKQKAYNDLFKTNRKVSASTFAKYAANEGWCSAWGGGEIRSGIPSGMNGDFKASLSSYFDFKELLEGKRLKADDVDEIITWITVFPDGDDILKGRIRQKYGEVLTSGDINRISKLKYSGWGRYSHKFLYEVQAMDKRTGELMSVMKLLWETQNTLAEILGGDYEFIEKEDKPQRIGRLDYSVVDALYVTPAVKKETWQALRIVDEIKRIMGCSPKKVFLGMSKGEVGAFKGVAPRRQALVEAFEEAARLDPNHADETNSLKSKLEAVGDDDLARQDKLYLYFTQCGRCMYSGERIDLDDIYDVGEYDIDHIYPRSKSNDDSISNKVLVKRKTNIAKCDAYPIDEATQEHMGPWWRFLYECGFIPKEKYDRLTRTTPLSSEETYSFVRRRLMETSQSAMQVADVLRGFFGDDTKVVHSKPRNTSAFRDEYGFVRCRTMNELHHAKDAYLNVVVGNVLDAKCTSMLGRECKDRAAWDLSTTFRNDVDGAWKAGDAGTIGLVRRTMDRNDVLFTRQPIERTGKMFDLQLVKKGAKKGALPAKASDSKLMATIDSFGNREAAFDDWTSKYGGYNCMATSHFAVVKHEEKGNTFVSFIPINMTDAKRFEDPQALLEYCKSSLGMENPSVARAKLLVNTQVKIDGYVFALSGKSNGGKVITLNSNVPLILSRKSQTTLKAVESFLRKRIHNRNMTPNPAYDRIDKENTRDLFAELLQKCGTGIYAKRPGSQAKVLRKSADLFESMDLLQRCMVIQELLKYYSMGSGQANLTLLNGSKMCGSLTKGAKSNLSSSSICIYDQSITGLFETIEEIKA